MRVIHAELHDDIENPMLAGDQSMGKITHLCHGIDNIKSTVSICLWPTIGE